VGFPGEEERHFNKLLQDMEKLRFEWLGVFTYSPEEETPAYSLTPEVPLRVREKRYQELMQLQQSITFDFNQKKLGRVYPILVDKESEGHTQFQAPEIDGKVFLGKKHLPGELFQGRISQVKDCYDLVSG